MPVYKNIGGKEREVETMAGTPKILSPGDSATTRKFYEDPDLELVNPEPLWQPMAMEPTDINLAALAGTPYESSIDGFTGAVVPVPVDAWWIDIIKISGTITVRRQTTTGPLEMLDRIDAWPFRIIEAAGTLTQLLVSGVGGTGSIQIQMYRKPMTY